MNRFLPQFWTKPRMFLNCSKFHVSVKWKKEEQGQEGRNGGRKEDRVWMEVSPSSGSLPAAVGSTPSPQTWTALGQNSSCVLLTSQSHVVVQLMPNPKTSALKRGGQHHLDMSLLSPSFRYFYSLSLVVCPAARLQLDVWLCDSLVPHHSFLRKCKTKLLIKREFF